MTKRKAFGISKDLNEGISQTINAVKNNAGQLRYEVIPLTKIQFDPENPRKLALQPKELLPTGNLSTADPLYDRKKKEYEGLLSLANSIKKSGVRNAVEVYKDGVYYRLISGERRVLGSMLAGKEDIQARILDSKPSELDIRYLQWIENIEREDLTIWERIQNVRQLITAYAQQESVEVTATSLKELLGCSLPHAMTFLAILNGPQDIQLLLEKNLISNLEKAAFLARIEQHSVREKLTKACIEGNASLSSLKKILAETYRIDREIKRVIGAPKAKTAKRVTLGFTHNLQVVKEIMMLIASQPHYESVHAYLADIDWQDYVSVSKRFQLMIKLMEKECL